ncbi:MAG: anaerobic ribonucleoside-triphosphate reductase activating protein [Clostridium sp.]|jgi:anaerobic ribonucleoside-triphosphate reductase activating protein|uniref:anaerobic ribonucleoside-triphosphate reductase activating protein n=1 Tax=Clostridium sp. TaxID=1506 RepID=UPI0025C1C371|nr:anaerobic ribonucleoside-triphosphate reductase activating protein [Clostridium sp.]MCH3965345.1 anaerobic ribonucleoside-triphosphate reductase activating protein [Clostridium sp.]MCI1714566.1 anaerobic ribonucleoside-triphosphate reductase activating protein [Clostridium sp.]MCI1798828.1 anaerobic ribonucleoside-triphosphate reductase activating protein [Clostridium sp.]MCI1812441.1 anaerobic ribonucleoside-triphosphate reductase activating protein [Clostridium sp.]MCI1869638.1 anaerobic 
MKDKFVRLAGIAYESLANGPGLRRVFFAQGCAHNCKGCFNPSTHDFKSGQLKNIDDLVHDVSENPLIKGVTFSGGDPFYQAEAFGYMAEKIKKLKLNIWCYTGYKFEYILDNMKRESGSINLLKNIDVLVDGKFEKDKMDTSLRFRGSSNQRIIDVQASFKSKNIILMEF